MTLLNDWRAKLMQILAPKGYMRVSGGPADGLVVPEIFFFGRSGEQRHRIETQDGDTVPNCLTLYLGGQAACYQWQTGRVAFQGPCVGHTHHTQEGAP